VLMAAGQRPGTKKRTTSNGIKASRKMVTRFGAVNKIS